MEHLRTYLSKAGETQRSFAQRVGLSPSHLNEILSGRKRPSLDVAFAISHASGGAVPVQAWDVKSSDGEIHHPFKQENSHDLSQPDTPSDAA